MDFHMRLLVLSVVVLMSVSLKADGALSRPTMAVIKKLNKEGPYLGIVVPNAFEMGPLLQSSSFLPHQTYPYLDFAGRRFRPGTLEGRKVILVMTGLGMLNSGIATQLLVNLFRVKGVLHFGIAGNANPDLEIGDVTIPHFWAHTGLWNWQRYGDGPDDELALESSGDYTRKIGYLKFSDYNINNNKEGNSSSDNFLNNVWYQPEEIFPIDGTPEVREHAFWVPVNKNYFSISKKLKDLELQRCINSTCLPRKPKVIRVKSGVSANTFVDNAAYREFLYSNFNVTPIDMESAAVALVCLQQRAPFIAFRALSDLAGGGSSMSNEANLFAPLAAQNAVTVLLKFVSLLS